MNKVKQGQDLIGIWSEDVIKYTSFETYSMILQEDGFGFIHWQQLGNGTIETFSWYIKNGLLHLKGIAVYSITDDEIIEKVKLSKMEVCDIEVYTCQKESLEGEQVSTLEFSKQLDWGMDTIVGLVEKDINNISFYKTMYMMVRGFNESN